MNWGECYQCHKETLHIINVYRTLHKDAGHQYIKLRLGCVNRMCKYERVVRAYIHALDAIENVNLKTMAINGRKDRKAD